MDINHTNNNGNNGFTLACLTNTNLDVIKYLVNDLKMDINHTNNYGNNGFTLACFTNTNLDVIKYLVNDLKMDINHTDNNGDNGFTLTCWKNTNLDVIKYLVNDLKMDINHTNNHGNNGFTSACLTNTNLDVIKYLVNDLKMDINHTNNYGDNGFTSACVTNTNLDVIKYLIEDTNIDMSLKRLQFEKIDNLAKIISKNKSRINKLLTLGSCKYSEDKMNKIINYFHPFMLSNSCFANLINDTYMNEFSEFKKMVDQFPEKIEERFFDTDIDHYSHSDIDYTQQPEILFENDGNCYYGNREKVYGSMKFLEDIYSNLDCKETIILDIPVPKYIISLYIDSCYNKCFKLNKVKPNDLMSFLKFIDRYPTIYLSIYKIKHELKFYFFVNKIKYNQYIEDICTRYKLKDLYVWIHNQKISE
jgi:hypothetical protein